MRDHKKDIHEFALYWSGISDATRLKSVGASIVIDDEQLCHRIARVLRLAVDETVVFFDQAVHVRCTIVAFRSKKSFEVRVLEIVSNVSHEPHVLFFLPLLKREAFEDALYSLVELGASEIQVMIPQKTQRAWGGQKEFDRLKTIMIAAAEQSKQYALPILYEPKKFDEACATLTHDEASCMLFFDAEGDALFGVIESLRTKETKNLSLMIGPEGDLTEQEKMMLKEKGVQFCRLTPTILRAQQAVAVSLGIFRSLL